MDRKRRVLVGVAIIVGAIVYLFVANLSSMGVYYYTMDELRDLPLEKAGRLRISGVLSADSIDYDPVQPRLHFTLRNTDGSFLLPVSFSDTMPDNFLESDELVVTGRFNGSEFVAESILVKCPSKYESGSKGEKG
jgi:cytochrome c-type biogenesis protein CcmE